MKLKEMITSDIDGVFINTDDFCEEHKIEGAPIACSIDSDSMLQLSGGETYSIGDSEQHIFAKTAELEAAGLSYRGYGSVIDIDGEMRTVTAWIENMGVTEIHLVLPEMS